MTEAKLKNVISNIEAGIASGKRKAEIRSKVEKMLSVNFHDGCDNLACHICFGNNDSLADALELASNRTDIDLLGYYHKWLKDNGISPETEFGWWSKEAFNPENVLSFSGTVYREECL